jgi:hypothetical protein
MRRTGLVVLVMCGLACGDRDRRAAPGAVPTELLKTRHLAVSVKIDGRGPFRLIFDTGSPVVMLSSRVAKECGLLEAGRKAPAAAGAWPGQVTLKTVEAGGVTADAVPAMIFDHPTVKAIERITGRIDGIIGFPFFARFRMEVDYGAARINLTPNGHQPKDSMASVMQGFFERSGKPRALAPAGQWGLNVEDPADGHAGVVVRHVFPDTPAAAAGFQPGDRLISIDGRWSDSVLDCVRAAAAVAPNSAVAAVVLRGGQERTLSVTPRAGF